MASGEQPARWSASSSAHRRLAALQQALVRPAFRQRSGVGPQPTMHSSGLRSENFSITDGGRPCDLPSFLPTIDRHTRVGVVAPAEGTEAAGAATLILAMITAFYNDLRANDPPGFFAYPDFFVFQPPARRGSPASYSMFDVWPSHKWVAVDGGRPVDWLRAVTDRGINVLLVADDVRPAEPAPSGDYSYPDAAGHRLDAEPADDYTRLALHSASRNISQCWAYSSEGQVRNGDVTVRFDPGNGGNSRTENENDLASWIHTIFEAERDQPLPMPAGLAQSVEEARRERGGCIEQSFRRVKLEEALTML